jgi:hypothetical protein
MDVKYIALYLPQFHPIEENDRWWGKGFTEWTNISKAKPLFKGHSQPVFPADLGYYDLRVEQTRVDQAAMAKEYGIDGFCYYHYWFKGKKLLERPASEMLASKKPDFPFCFCWANETWSRRWTGEEQEVLIKQDYSEEDDKAHAHYLIPFFSDHRYITVNGRPLFVIYRPQDLPNPAKTIETFKTICLAEGVKEPFMVASNSHLWDNEKILSFGFDAVLNFRPQLGILPYANEDEFIFKRLIRNLKKFGVFNGSLKLFDYAEALEIMKIIEPENFDQIIPSVFVGWDNTPRRGSRGIVIQDSHPDLFEKELLRITEKLTRSNSNIVFMNAWNEWAEGNKLEPDKQFLKGYLESIQNVKQKFNEIEHEISQ